MTVFDSVWTHSRIVSSISFLAHHQACELNELWLQGRVQQAHKSHKQGGKPTVNPTACLSSGSLKGEARHRAHLSAAAFAFISAMTVTG